MVGKEGVPIFLKLMNNGNDSFVSFQDYGLGMSPDIMNNIYFNYLDSTKELSNSVIGCYGIGSKVALAYTHTFFIDTIWNGILYHYMFSKQSNGIPAGELLYTEVTDECNGTTIKVPIKESDCNEFHNAINSQLTYFPNVYVESYRYFDNTYKIYEFDDFLYRPDCSNVYSGYRSVHMCIGNVAYPIDYAELGINPINIPIALKFSIGELTPTPSRENIVYSRESIAIIKDKLSKMFEYLGSQYSKKTMTVNSIEEYKDYYGKIDNDIELADDVFVTIPSEIIKNKKYFKGFKRVSIKGTTEYIDSDTLYDLRFFGWELHDKAIGDNGYQVNSGYNRSYNYSGTYKGKVAGSDLANWCDRYPLSYGYNGLKTSLWSYTSCSKAVLLRREDNLVSFYKNIYLKEVGDIAWGVFRQSKLSLETWKKIIFQPLLIPKHLWRYHIELITKSVDEFINSFGVYYHSVDVPKDWLIAYKEKVKLSQVEVKAEKKSDKITCKFLKRDYSYGYIWEDIYDTPQKIRSVAKNIVWVEMNDKKEAKDLHSFLNSINFKGKDKIYHVIAIAKSHIKKYFKDDPNVIFYDDFLIAKSNINKKIAMAYYSYMKLSGYYSPMSSTAISIVNNRYYNDAEKMYDLYKKYQISNYGTVRRLQERIYKNAVNCGNIDDSFISNVNRLHDISVKVSRIHSVLTFGYKLPNIIAVADSFKRYNLEIDKSFYLKPEFNKILYNENK